MRERNSIIVLLTVLIIVLITGCAIPPAQEEASPKAKESSPAKSEEYLPEKGFSTAIDENGYTVTPQQVVDAVAKYFEEHFAYSIVSDAKATIKFVPDEKDPSPAFYLVVLVIEGHEYLTGSIAFANDFTITESLHATGWNHFLYTKEDSDFMSNIWICVSIFSCMTGEQVDQKPILNMMLTPHQIYTSGDLYYWVTGNYHVDGTEIVVDNPEDFLEFSFSGQLKSYNPDPNA